MSTMRRIVSSLTSPLRQALNKASSTLLLAMPNACDCHEPWEDTKPIEPQGRHYRSGMVSIAIAVLSFAAMVKLFPASRKSPLLMLGDLVGWLSGSDAAGVMFGLATVNLAIILLVLKLSRSHDSLAALAMREEKLCRAGTEDWSRWERFRASAVFGALHIMNLYVPISATVGLALSGWWFSRVYLSAFAQTHSRVAALKQSCAVHTAHNRLILRIALPLGGLGYMVWLVFGLHARAI
jgi:cytochrome b561